MTPKQFVEKAVEGGWRYGNVFDRTGELTVRLFSDKHVAPPMEVAYLDPKAWEAVGKVDGWKWHCAECRNERESEGFYCEDCDMVVTLRIGWEFNMHRMVDFLVEGKSIEQYLETL